MWTEKGGEMIRALPIFDLFRHGRAESALREDFVFVTASTLELVAGQEESLDRSNDRPRVHSHWFLTQGEGNRHGLRMSWTLDRKEGRQQ